MSGDITPEEAASFNEDCACVEGRIRDRLLISPVTEQQDMDVTTHAIVTQLFHRWFGFEYTGENYGRIREVRKLIREFDSASKESPQRHA